MNSIEVTVYAKQGDWDSDNLWYDETDRGVLNEIKAAKKHGLKVALILRVALDHAFERNKFLWHGMILPGNNQLINNWFERYTRFTLKWAQIAREEGVDIFVIGSELNALSATIPIRAMPALIDYYSNPVKQNRVEKRVLKFEQQLKENHLWVRGFDNYQNPEQYIDDRIHAHLKWARQVAFGMKSNCIKEMNLRRNLLRNHWIKLIKASRKVYKGQMSYAANFDSYMEVDWWKHLNFIGINAYFPLRDLETSMHTPERIEENMKTKWLEVFESIRAFKQKIHVTDKPVFFTELGYSYRENSTIEPWKGFGFSVVGKEGREKLIIWKEQSVNRQERTFAVNALHQAVKQSGFPLKGILYWKLTTHNYHIPVEPFVLHIAPEPTDNLQPALLQFVN